MNTEKIFQESLIMENNNLIAFFKRGKSEHIQSLYETGEIYINTFMDMRKMDNNFDRSDPEDCIEYRKNLGISKVTMANVGSDIETEGVTVEAENARILVDTIDKGNIYSLSALHAGFCKEDSPNWNYNIDSFGPSLIVINEPYVFLERVLEALRQANFIDIQHQLVEYYNNSHSGKVGKFRKHERFKGQLEYRIYVPNPIEEPIKVYAGSLADIASIKHNNQKCRLTLTFNTGRQQYIDV